MYQCREDKHYESRERFGLENDMNRKLKKIISIVCAACMACALAACGKESIEGTWSRKQNDAVTTYVFNADNTGSMDVGQGIVLPITYSLEGNTLKLSYTFLGTQTEEQYDIVIEKKTITLSNASSSITLEKQE